jgi:hypothetical protein
MQVLTLKQELQDVQASIEESAQQSASLRDVHAPTSTAAISTTAPLGHSKAIDTPFLTKNQHALALLEERFRVAKGSLEAAHAAERRSKAELQRLDQLTATRVHSFTLQKVHLDALGKLKAAQGTVERLKAHLSAQEAAIVANEAHLVELQATGCREVADGVRLTLHQQQLALEGTRHETSEAAGALVAARGAVSEALERIAANSAAAPADAARQELAGYQEALVDTLMCLDRAEAGASMELAEIDADAAAVHRHLDGLRCRRAQIELTITESVGDSAAVERLLECAAKNAEEEEVASMGLEELQSRAGAVKIALAALAARRNHTGVKQQLLDEERFVHGQVYKSGLSAGLRH